MTTWPVEPFPQIVDREGWSETFPMNVIETENDVGPPKQRRRANSMPRMHQMNLTLSAEEMVEFDTFWSVDCAQGSLPFDWINPRTGSVHSFQWIGKQPPVVTNPGGTTYKVSFSVRQLA